MWRSPAPGWRARRRWGGRSGRGYRTEGYRRRGYGYELTLAMIDRLRKMGRLPSVQIEEANAASMKLALKTGFIPDRRVSWFQTAKD
ncbi:MAG: GNAT family N-acetyltransferase [Bacteroidota bacterium]